MNKLPTSVEFPYSPINSFRRTNPFTIMYIYPRYGHPFVVKGGLNDCDEYLKRFLRPALIHITYWHHGLHRTSIRIINTSKRIYLMRTFDSNVKKTMIEIYVSEVGIIKTIKRVPRKWIKELDPFC